MKGLICIACAVGAYNAFKAGNIFIGVCCTICATGLWFTDKPRQREG